MVLMGAILMLTGAALGYVAFADPEATTGTSIFLLAVGFMLLIIGVKLAFGLERVSLDPAARTWQSVSGAVFRKKQNGSFDELEAVVLERQEHRHGAQHYDMFRVFFRKNNKDELHAGMDRSEEAAREAALALSAKTGLPFKDETEEDDMQ